LLANHGLRNPVLKIVDADVVFLAETCITCFVNLFQGKS